jgi:hypothetical protein
MSKTTVHKADSNSIIKQWTNLGSIAAFLWLAFCFGQTVQENKDNVKLIEQSNKHTVELIDYKIKLSKYENDSTYKE